MIKGWRTILWNILNLIPVVMNLVDTKYVIPEEWMPYWIILFIVVNLILRYNTTTAVGKKE